MAPSSMWLSSASCLLMLVAAVLAIFRREANHRLNSSVVLVAAIALLLAAASASGLPTMWQSSRFFFLGVFPATFTVDTLAAVFLALLAVVSLAVALFSPGYLKHLDDRIHSGQYWASFFLFLISMALVVLSADAITFIVFWELMSLSSVALVAAEHKLHQVQRAALIYLGATRIATAFLAGGFIWMHTLTHSWTFADWHFNSSVAYAPAALILLGFCIKAGIWPFHIWLPYAHPAAPAPVSSLMSGVMIKIALYGLIRTLVLGDLNCVYLAYLALFLGTVSAFWGVLFALVQHDLKRLLAYHSVENVGLILIGIALALLCRSAGLPQVAAIGLAAAIFHCVNHGLFKSLLFFGAGSVDAAAHTRNLAQLGGLGRRMPWTMACFLIGSASICALPPLNGFASKWLVYQGLFQNVWQSHSLIDRGLSLAVICVLGLVGGLALACFSKALAVTFLGEARSHLARDAHDVTTGMIASQVVLTACCVGLGLSAPMVLRIVNPICRQAVHQTTDVASTFVLPETGIAIALIALVMLIYLFFLQTSRERRYITWECGFGSRSPRSQVSPDSFAQPVAWIFSPILRYKLSVEIAGKDRRHFPERIKVEPQTVSLLENRIYRPALSYVSWLARVLAKIQAGSIHLYLVYLCLTLVLLLFLGTRL